MEVIKLMKEPGGLYDQVKEQTHIEAIWMLKWINGY